MLAWCVQAGNGWLVILLFVKFYKYGDALLGLMATDLPPLNSLEVG